MNKTTEALKLAEEALPNILFAAKERDRKNRIRMFDNCIYQAEEALAAIREALAEHPMDYDQGFVDGVEAQLAEPVKHEVHQEPVTVPANGLLQQEPFRSTPTGSQSEEIIQPFAYYCDELSADGRLVDREYNGINQFSAGRFGKPLYAAPVQPVKQEPVAWMFVSKYTGDRTLEWCKVSENYSDHHFEVPLYAAPVGAEHFLKAIAALREGIATCRAEALEEAAKVAEETIASVINKPMPLKNIVAAIRGLK